MSRIGKKPILIPQGVSIAIDGETVKVSGPKGNLEQVVRSEIKVEIQDGQIIVSPTNETKEVRAYWGLFRSLIANMVEGVVSGFEKKLEISGLGYRAAMEGRDIVLQVGFSHPVKVTVPEGVEVSVEKNIITVSGLDKGIVTHTAARIRKTKPAEPYKGKGLKYEGEQIRRKTGKRVGSGSAA
ncbi:MAG: 50S ribosomal protein L6 [Patescibacteria group bacterium]